MLLHCVDQWTGLQWARNATEMMQQGHCQPWGTSHRECCMFANNWWQPADFRNTNTSQHDRPGSRAWSGFQGPPSSSNSQEAGLTTELGTRPTLQPLNANKQAIQPEHAFSTSNQNYTATLHPVWAILSPAVTPAGGGPDIILCSIAFLLLTGGSGPEETPPYA